MPLLLLVLMGIVQCSLIVHAHHVAQAVAARAVDTAREQGGSDAAGAADGRGLLASLGTRALGDPQVAVQRTQSTVTATVTGQVTGIVPFWRPKITAHAAGPVERLTTGR
jgi:Flp pilus assembly protein TadG